MRWLTAAAIAACTLGSAGAARADTLFIEAEGPGDEGRILSNEDARITSPMLIKDDSAASMGRYITVQTGLNSQASPPGVEGMAAYRFHVDTGGNYRIWGRVIAPTVNDDSFWVRIKNVTTGTSFPLVRWNDIAPGTTWHWAQVINDGTTTPVQFALAPFNEYEMQVSYREDGAKLDVLVVTDDTSFNPKAPPKTAPAVAPNLHDAPKAIPRKLTAGSRGGIRLHWSEVPGAKSYTVTRSSNGVTNTITGITGHTFTDTGKPPTVNDSNCYDVTAIFPDGSSSKFTRQDTPTPENPNPPITPEDDSVCQEGQLRMTFLDTASTITGSAPMVSDQDANTAYSAPGTPSSPNAPPAHGRLRFDFGVGAASKVRIWFVVNVTDKQHDSFWARMDDGAWIKWNNIGGCQPVWDSDNGDKPVTFSLATGTHRFELATRETGVVNGVNSPELSNIFFVTDDLNVSAFDLCND